MMNIFGLPPPMPGMPPPRPTQLYSMTPYPTSIPTMMQAEDPSGAGMMQQASQVGILLEGPGARKEYIPYTLPKLTSSQEELVELARKFALEQSIKSVLVKQTIAHQQQQMQNFQTAVQRQQALALMCRIYIGSINFDIKEETVKTAFLAFGPIKSIDLSWDAIANKHKGFAFIEYEVPEAAQLSLEQMNSVLIGGRNIKVGRPSNMPQAQPIIAELQQESKDFTRIYVASIHTDLTENDIKSVFEAFGTIKSIQLGMDPARQGRHRGYGYIEYDNSQSAQDAVSSMNLFDLGGQFLRVGKCITPPEVLKFNTTFSTMPTASAVAAATITAKIAAMDAAQQPVQVVVPPPALANPATITLSNAGSPAPTTLTPTSQYVAPPHSPPPALANPATITLSNAGSPAPTTLTPTSQYVAPPITLATPLQLSTPLTSLHAPAPVPKPDTNYKKEKGLTIAQKKLVEDPAQSLAQQENMEISGTNARHMVMQKLMRQAECQVMVLRNMVGVEDLDDDLEHEVTEECGKFGPVDRVIIYQERQSEEEAVDAAINGLNNRYFGGRIVRAEKYDQELYDANDLSG